jgi:hypothetical protein
MENIKDGFKDGFDDTKAKIVNASHKAVDDVKAAIQGNKAVDNVVHAAAEDVKDDINKVVHKAESDIQKGVHKVEGDVQKDVHAVDNVVHKAEVDIPKYVHDVVNATEHPKATFESAVKGAKKLIQDAKKLLNFTKIFHFSPKFPGLNITLIKRTFNCPPLFPGFQVDANPSGTFNGTVGVSVSGFLYPPRVVTFQIIASE